MNQEFRLSLGCILILIGIAVFGETMIIAIWLPIIIGAIFWTIEQLIKVIKGNRL